MTIERTRRWVIGFGAIVMLLASGLLVTGYLTEAGWLQSLGLTLKAIIGAPTP